MAMQYIGARYVPIIYTNPDDGSANWKSGVEYEPLTVVVYDSDSYTSKKPVPVNIGAPADNPKYWVKTGDFNASLLALQREVQEIDNDINDETTGLKVRMTATENDIDALEEQNGNEALDTTSHTLSGAVNEVYKYVKGSFYTPEMFGGVGDGTNDDTLAIQNAVNAGNLRLMPNKTYAVSSPITVPSNRVVYGSMSTIKIADGVEISFTGNEANSIFKLYNVENVHIYDVIFDCNGDSLPTYSDVTKQVNVAIGMENCGNISVKNCNFINGYTTIIWMHSNKSMVDISDNTFNHIYQEQGLNKEGVYCVGNNGGFLSVNNNKFVEDDISAAYGASAIFFANVYNAECIGNHIQNCGRNNTLLHPVAAICLYDNCKNVTVRNNFIHSIESFIRADSCKGVVIADNYCVYDKSLPPHSPYIRATLHSETTSEFDYYGDISIEGNTLDINPAAGASAAIGISRPTTATMELKNFTIKNNVIITSGQGIMIHHNVKSVLIANNKLGVSSEFTYIHIPDGGENITIDSNTLYNGCLDLTREADGIGTIKSMKIVNNHIECHLNRSIMLNNAENVLIADNEIIGRGVRSSNATTSSVFAHDNSMHNLDDEQTEIYVGSDILQHDNYYDGVLYPNFQ